ncbi:hypothetical protein [Desulfosarcina ovata]|nr:hypothetical protein [Desulfosarcina ovata]
MEWTIGKKAGHLRPKLHYTLTLEDFEIDLAVPMVRITSTIPKPPDAGQHYVWPGTKECGKEEPEEVYDLCTPSHKTGHCREMLMLPMRPGNNYPEVEVSFRQLRRAYEEALLAAYANSAFEIGGRLEMTPETKRRMAPAVAARRFLAVVGQVS